MIYSLKAIRLAAAGAIVLTGAACATTTPTDGGFGACMAMAETREAQAVSARSVAQYQVAAKHLEYCVELAGGSESEPVMKAQAQAALTYFKAGDIPAARAALDSFRTQFPHRDLFLEDGTSFIESAALLFGELPTTATKAGSLTNASAALKSELRRADYWQRN